MCCEEVRSPLRLPRHSYMQPNVLCCGEVRSPLRLPRHPYMQPNVMCSGEVRSPLRLPRHPYIQPNVLYSGKVRSPLRLPRHPYMQPNVLSSGESEKPTEITQTPLHAAKRTVWAAISERGIIRPFFFKEHGPQVTAMKERYVEVIEDFKKELESLYPSLMTKFWFRQLSHFQYVLRMV